MNNNLAYWKGALIDCRRAVKTCMRENKTVYMRAIKYAERNIKRIENQRFKKG